MNILTLYTKVTEAIANDSLTKTWSNTTYSQNHKVLEGFDARNLPESADYPLVAVTIAEKIVGREIANKHHVLLVQNWIKDENSQTHISITNLTQYLGAQRIESFRKLTETAIAGITGIGNVIAGSKFAIEYDMTRFPFFGAFMMVEFSEQWTLGADVLL